MTRVSPFFVYCSIMPRLVAASPVASWPATKPAASPSTTAPPDVPTMTLLSLLFEGSQLKKDRRRMLLGSATRAGLEGFDRAGKQEERGKNGTMRFLIRGSVG